MSSHLAIGQSSNVLLARELPAAYRAAGGEGWSLDALAGLFVEVCGDGPTAAFTAVAALVLDAQRRRERTAWIGGHRSSFYPPDFAASGIDLEALPVVRVEDATQGARAADTLLRSGGFALIVLDLGREELPLKVQSRLLGLAKKHNTTLLSITRNARQSSRGSLVSLRGETNKTRMEQDCFTWELRAVKDKRRAPGWTHREVCRGPDGLC